MKLLLRLCGLLLVLACLPATAQISSLKVAKVNIEHVGPLSVSDELIRANIRIKPLPTLQPFIEGRGVMIFRDQENITYFTIAGGIRF